VLDLDLPEGATARDALERCRDLPEFSDVPLMALPVGIYGREVPLDTVLQADDRLEIYRPLLADPKEARRRRTVKRRS
jgi:putative ubiquitin-RnfH superfamily antitoxin RatB of RatAB toxin-antitoxin module